MAACLVALTLTAAPAIAQTPAPGSIPPPSGQGAVIGTPQGSGDTTERSWGMGIPLAYLGLVGLAGGAVLWFVVSRRRRR